MSWIEDGQKKGFKVYREHTPLVDPEWKAVQFGLSITDQDDITGEYSHENVGDESSWVFWEKDTRETGSWAPIWLTVVGAGDTLWPIVDGSLGADSSYSSKTVQLTSGGGDNTLVRTIGVALPDVGTFGFVMQMSIDSQYELVFIPTSEQALKADHVNSPTTSTKIYSVLAGGALNPSNVGDLDDIVIVYSNVANLIYTAKWYFDDGGTIRSAPFEFKGGAVPAGMSEVGLYYDTVGGNFKWYGNSSLIVDDADSISTPVYGTLAGAVDPTNVGMTSQILTVKSNEVFIETTSKFYQTGTRKGAIDFQAGTFPTVITPTSPVNYETNLVWDSATSKWRLYTAVDTSSATIYAKIAWFFDHESDLSEGEIVTYDSATDTFLDSGSLIWIDWTRSKACPFETMGTSTVFEVALLSTSKDRFGVVRDLYFAKNCISDRGNRIAAFNRVGNANNSTKRIFCSVFTDTINDKPWINPSSLLLKTVIGGVEKINQVLVRIPREWDLGGGNWVWTELSDLSKGLPYYARPVDPQKTEGGLWEFKEDDTVYSTYRR